MRLLSTPCTGVQLGNSSSPETHWKAFLLKINPVRPRPASQPCQPCAACRLANPSPLIHCNVPFIQKPSYGCAWAGTGAFKPSATLACLLRHPQNTSRHKGKAYIMKTQIVSSVACGCRSKHSTSWKARTQHIGTFWPRELASHKSTHSHDPGLQLCISNSMTGL